MTLNSCQSLPQACLQNLKWNWGSHSADKGKVPSSLHHTQLSKAKLHCTPHIHLPTQFHSPPFPLPQHTLPADPCQFGGTCTNTEGSFQCQCQSGFTGHRCQYNDVCERAESPCPANQTCVETISNTQGYVCQDVTTNGAVVVTGIVSGPGNLDDQVNNIQEVCTCQT